jgi:uncharacterized protein (DUF849 family)
VPKSVIITCAATVGAAQAATMGGNLRVGLENSLYISKGELAKSNADQVTRIRALSRPRLPCCHRR